VRSVFDQLFDTFLVMLGVSALVFFLLAFVPGDPVDVILGESAQAADREAMRVALGLDRPWSERLLDYYAGLLHGDLGDSLVRRTPVTDLILERLPATLMLAAAAFAWVVVVAIPLGIAAAWYQGRWPDRAARVLALIGVSIPNFWLGPLLVLVFSIGLGWTPVSGNDEPGGLLLPAATLGLSLMAITTRMMRSSLLEIISMPYLRTARCKGLSESRVIWRHALPNAVLPTLTILGLQLGALLAGAVITEVVFAWPGIGSLLIEAVQQRDYPVIQGVVLVIALIYVIVNRGTDLLVARLDPRIGDFAR
jgi:ABC-type dipeptide/oligopeptide/nickel transport system permease component